MNFELSRQIFEKFPDTNFNENLFDGSRVVPSGLPDRRQTDRQTDRHDKINSPFSQFFELTKKKLVICKTQFCRVPVHYIQQNLGCT